MKVGVITGREQAELLEMPKEEPRPGAVRVAVTLCGICGTEVASYRSGVPHSPSVCGHEWVGVIDALGEGVTSRQIGQRVVVSVAPPCGSCPECLAGESHHCRETNLMARGRDALAPSHGAFAPYLCVAADRTIPALDSLTDVEAAFVEPTAVALHGVRRSGIRVGDVVLVQGGGTIGLLAAQCARIAGAGRVIVSEPSAFRREVARAVGVDEAVAPEEVAAVLAETSNGRGADVVIESAGVPALLQAAIDACRQGGTVMLLSYVAGDTPINGARLLAKEVTIRTAVAFTHDDFVPAMQLLADGRVVVGPIHSRTVPLGDFAQAMADLGSGRTQDIKVIVDPRESS